MPTDRLLHHWERDNAEVVAGALNTTPNPDEFDVNCSGLKDEVVVVVSLGASTQINLPTNGRAGQSVRYFVTNSSGGNITLTVQSGYVGAVVAASGVVGASKVRFLRLFYTGSVWFLTDDIQAA